MVHGKEPKGTIAGQNGYLMTPMFPRAQSASVTTSSFRVQIPPSLLHSPRHTTARGTVQSSPPTLAGNLVPTRADSQDQEQKTEMHSLTDRGTDVGDPKSSGAEVGGMRTVE
jgi:hypothetical protein